MHSHVKGTFHSLLNTGIFCLLMQRRDIATFQITPLFYSVSINTISLGTCEEAKA